MAFGVIAIGCYIMTWFPCNGQRDDLQDLISTKRRALRPISANDFQINSNLILLHWSVLKHDCIKYETTNYQIFRNSIFKEKDIYYDYRRATELQKVVSNIVGELRRSLQREKDLQERVKRYQDMLTDQEDGIFHFFLINSRQVGSFL